MILKYLIHFLGMATRNVLINRIIHDSRVVHASGHISDLLLHFIDDALRACNSPHRLLIHIEFRVNAIQISCELWDVVSYTWCRENDKVFQIYVICNEVTWWSYWIFGFHFNLQKKTTGYICFKLCMMQNLNFG